MTTTKLQDLEHFHEWYARVAQEDAVMIWKKAKEYGSLDFHAKLVSPPGMVYAVDLEHVVGFYVGGKLGRIMNALARGELASIDCWRDVACYAMMARRIRETHTWPG